MRLVIPAYAKINLTLDVLGTRPDGYHNLRMVMQSVNLCDRLAIETGTGTEEISLRCNVPGIPCDERNLVHRAIVAFYEATGVTPDGISVAIEKRIPAAAGLAGGSTDAAAVIRGLDRIYNTRLTSEELRAIGLKIGADVPFCISGGTKLAEGVGEVLSPLPSMPDCILVLVKPEFSMSTPYVFKALDAMTIDHRPNADAMAAALEKQDLAGVSQELYNVMELVTASEHPEIDAIKAELIAHGALGAVMSGSGPTVFGIFRDTAAAHAAYAALLPQYEGVFLCRPKGENGPEDMELAQ